MAGAGEWPGDMTHSSGLLIRLISFNKEKWDPGSVTCGHLHRGSLEMGASPCRARS